MVGNSFLALASEGISEPNIVDKGRSNACNTRPIYIQALIIPAVHQYTHAGGPGPCLCSGLL